MADFLELIPTGKNVSNDNCGSAELLISNDGQRSSPTLYWVPEKALPLRAIVAVDPVRSLQTTKTSLNMSPVESRFSRPSFFNVANVCGSILALI